MTEAYYGSVVPREELENDLRKGLQDLDSRAGLAESPQFGDVGACLKEMGEKKRRNLAIESEVVAMTDVSRQQSDSYIEQVVARLLDAKTEKSVSARARGHRRPT